jgi:hypothetical protein
MEQCCLDIYSGCGKILPCFETLAIRVPLSYTGETIAIQFLKNIGGNQVPITVGGEINSGWVAFDSDVFPAAFFNAYGGAFQAQFISENNQPLPFTAIDGIQYDAFYIEFYAGISPIVISQINIFDTAIY